MDNDKSTNFAREDGAIRTSVKAPPSVFWILLGTTGVIFISYEIIERTWLTNADPRLIHILHIVRGLGTCIIVSLLAVWYVLRAGPSIFPSKPMDSSYSLIDEASQKERIEHFCSWFIRMRWLACVVATVLIVVIVKLLQYLDDETFFPLTSLVLCVVASNLIFGFLLRTNRLTRHLLELQIGTDLVILTAMLHFSGGIENSLLLVYVFHVIIGGILLSRRKCYAIVLMACTLFAILAFAEMSGAIKHYTLLIFPHSEETRYVEGVEEELLPEHGGVSGDGEHLLHAAHDPVYVTSIVLLQVLLLVFAAYFTVTIMEQLRGEHQRLQTVRQRLERVLQATGTGFTIVDRSLRPVWQNDQIKHWLNLAGGAAVDDTVRLDSWTGGKEGAAARTFKDGQVRYGSRQLIDEHGNKRFFDATVAPLVDETGGVYEVVELTQDVTEKKILQAQAVNAAKMAALGTLAAGVAHEVGNPLASMTTRLQLLEVKHDESFLKESVGLLQKQISRISRIVRDISQFSRPAQKEWSSCQINTLVLDTLTLLRFHRESKIAHIESQLAESLPEIMGVQDELAQVFLNLGLNALEAMEHEGTLTVSTLMRGREIEVEFADTGRGIAGDIQDRMFEPFVTGKEAGTGLGLSIAHRIIASYGGRIEARNIPEGGAAFTVILPLRSTV